MYFLCTMGDWDRRWWCGNGVRGGRDDRGGVSVLLVHHGGLE